MTVKGYGIKKTDGTWIAVLGGFDFIAYGFWDALWLLKEELLKRIRS